MIKVFDSLKGMHLFEDASEQAWVQDGLALQIQLLQGDTSSSPDREAVIVPAQPHKNAEDEIYLLVPKVSAIERARECAEEFGTCSIEEMQDLIPSK